MNNLRALRNKRGVSQAVQREYNRFVTGEDLADLTKGSATLNKRDAFAKLDNWVSEFSSNGHIGALLGLRRTGKTIILHQLANKYHNKNIKVAYASYGYKQHEFNVVLAAVDRLVEEGHKLILLDEITRAEGFYDGAMHLADLTRAKVVIAGTESLMLHWSTLDPLFGRTVKARTTGMRYSEYVRLFPGLTIIDFINKGGVFWADNKPDVVEYLRSSVVENIKNSINLLEDWHKFTIKESLRNIDSDTVLRILEAICECGVLYDIANKVRRDWDSEVAWKLSNAHKNVRGISSELLPVYEGIHKFYSHKPKGNFDESVVDVLIQNLRLLNFVSEITEFTDVNKWVDKLVITQPYVKTDFLRRTLSVFEELSDELSNLGLTRDRMISLCYGVVLEDIVYFEAAKRYAGVDNKIFKFRYGNNQEVDVVIHILDINTGKSSLHLFEVKLTDTKYKTGVNDIKKGDDKHLIDPNCIAVLERHFGSIIQAKTILYRGASDDFPDENGVRWINVEEWLLDTVR